MPRTLALVLVIATPGLLQAQDSTGIKSYSRFDFVPASQEVLLFDFSTDAGGDFPAGRPDPRPSGRQHGLPSQSVLQDCLP